MLVKKDTQNVWINDRNPLIRKPHFYFISYVHFMWIQQFMQHNDYHCVSIIIFNVACDVGCDVFT